jgi:hypothetical protein
MVDRYTKAVLTVIAAALTALAIQGLVRPLGAQTGEVQKVQICDGRHCLSLTPHTTSTFGPPVTDWVLPARIDDVQKVEICDGAGIAASCAAVDGLGSKGSLRVSPR